MNKGMFFGWKSVCGFTYMQTMKSKVMKIVMTILFAIVVLSMPLITLFTSKDKDAEESKIKTAYIFSNYDYLQEKLDGLDLTDSNFEKVSVEVTDKDEKAKLLEDMKENEDTSDVLVEIIYDNNPESMDYGIEVKLIYGEKGPVEASDANGFAEMIAESIDELVLKGSDMEESVLEKLLKENYFEIYTVDADGVVSSGNNELNNVEYWVTYAFLMVAMFSIIIAGQKVAELIVTEKTSKVMEYLLTSVKPLALLIGKVISTMLIVFTLIAGVGVGLLISLVLNKMIDNTEGFWPEALVNIVESGAFQGLSFVNIVVAVVMVLVGFVFYCLLAGLAGATVGKVEELAEGLKMFTFTLVVGCYLVIALMMMASGGSAPELYSNVVYYLPLSSMFIVPIYVLLGKVSLSMALISLGILAVATVVMWYFVTKVFEHVLYNSGSVIKFKEVLAMYKMNAGKSEVHDGK